MENETVLQVGMGATVNSVRHSLFGITIRSSLVLDGLYSALGTMSPTKLVIGLR